MNESRRNNLIKLIERRSKKRNSPLPRVIDNIVIFIVLEDRKERVVFEIHREVETRKRPVPSYNLPRSFRALIYNFFARDRVAFGRLNIVVPLTAHPRVLLPSSPHALVLLRSTPTTYSGIGSLERHRSLDDPRRGSRVPTSPPSSQQIGGREKKREDERKQKDRIFISARDGAKLLSSRVDRRELRHRGICIAASPPISIFFSGISIETTRSSLSVYKEPRAHLRSSSSSLARSSSICFSKSSLSA